MANRTTTRCVIAVIAELPGACLADPSQNALKPGGPAAAQISSLWWYLFWVAAGVFAITMGILVVGVLRKPRSDSDGHSGSGHTFVAVSGIAIPAVILFVTLLVSLKATVALRVPPSNLTVQVQGHQWWWGVHYPRENITTANEIYIPAGQPVRLELTSADVAHSFWVPSLNGKMDLIPGHPNVFWIAADKPGTYRGQCAEYCGTQHAKMAFLVIALPPEDFRAWVARMKAPRPQTSNAVLAQGQQVFFKAACKDCHAVEGTKANGRKGPDLTHVGSRLTLGAGTLQNTPGALEGWVSDSQSAKPGNQMPRSYLPPDDLHALRAWLESLN
jgi:cytochrome c oxidase subunit II